MHSYKGYEFEENVPPDLLNQLVDALERDLYDQAAVTLPQAERTNEWLLTVNAGVMTAIVLTANNNHFSLQSKTFLVTQIISLSIGTWARLIVIPPPLLVPNRDRRDKIIAAMKAAKIDDATASAIFAKLLPPLDSTLPWYSRWALAHRKAANKYNRYIDALRDTTDFKTLLATAHLYSLFLSFLIQVLIILLTPHPFPMSAPTTYSVSSQSAKNSLRTSATPSPRLSPVVAPTESLGVKPSHP
jgi:hypothetical protein